LVSAPCGQGGLQGPARGATSFPGVPGLWAQGRRHVGTRGPAKKELRWRGVGERAGEGRGPSSQGSGRPLPAPCAIPVPLPSAWISPLGGTCACVCYCGQKDFLGLPCLPHPTACPLSGFSESEVFPRWRQPGITLPLSSSSLLLSPGPPCLLCTGRAPTHFALCT
jgi:hypothetical protein